MKGTNRKGKPLAGIMNADEMEGYLEARDPAIRAQIEKSNADIAVRRTRPAGDLLAELRATSAATPRRSAKR